MRWLSRLALAAASCAVLAEPSPAAAQTGFEGTVTFAQHSTDGKQSTMIQTSKGRKLRIEGLGDHGDGKGGAAILDGDAKSMTMIMPEEKKYMTITQEDAQRMAAMMKPMQDKMKQMHSQKAADAEEDKAKVDFAKTGRTETVAGVRCEVWHGTTVRRGKTQEGDACLADGVGFSFFDMMAANPMMQGKAMGSEFEQYRKAVGPGKGILKITTIKDGKPLVELEATKIDRRHVSDDEFKAPAGYTEVKMGQMMQQGMQKTKKPADN
jgi:hypothetical protein